MWFKNIIYQVFAIYIEEIMHYRLLASTPKNPSKMALKLDRGQLLLDTVHVHHTVLVLLPVAAWPMVCTILKHLATDIIFINQRSGCLFTLFCWVYLIGLNCILPCLLAKFTCLARCKKCMEQFINALEKSVKFLKSVK